MNQGLILSSALATALALGLAAEASAQEKGKEKCYGVAKAGQNDCANLSGSHTCAGQAKSDSAPEEWRYVAAGSCVKLNGLSEAQAKARLKS